MLHDMSKRLSPKQHESVIGPAGDIVFIDEGAFQVLPRLPLKKFPSSIMEGA